MGVIVAAYRSSGWSVNLNFHHLSFNNFCLLSVKENDYEKLLISNNDRCKNTIFIVFPRLLDSHADGLPESLTECLGLAHLQGKDLTSGQSCEGRISSKRLCDAYV